LEGCRLAVFDLDGTLYRQGPVRRAMLRDLLLVGGPPGRVARLRVLRRFRQLREEMAVAAPRGFDEPLFARLAAETGRPEAALRALVREWMDERPLPYLRRALVAGAAELLPALRERGIVTAIWSDYPVPDKLAALGLAADHVVSALDRDVGALKPDPAGLALLLTRTGLRPDQALMIGDRTSHDGRAAAALSVPFLLRARKAPPGTASVADFRSLVRGLGAA
jgi:FMN phosphatase YigB (HAD superfamily)